MEGFAVFLFVLVYIGIIIYIIKLGIRFVNAIEKMTTSIGKIADKYDRN
jgi:uncharacterized membrane protein